MPSAAIPRSGLKRRSSKPSITTSVAGATCAVFWNLGSRRAALMGTGKWVRAGDVLPDISIQTKISAVSMPISSGATEDVCPQCHGAGFLRMEVPVGHPNFGRLFPCQCKLTEMSDRTHIDLERRSNLDAFSEKTF